MSGQNFKLSQKRHHKKTIIVIVIIVVLLVGAAVAYFLLTTHNKSVSPPPNKNTTQKQIDARSTISQQASQKASEQVAQGDSKAAVQTLGDAADKVSDKSEKSSLYSQQSAILAQSGQTNDAIAAGKQAIATDPSNWKPYANLGYTYQALGDKPNAINYLQQALDILKKQSNTSNSVEIQGAINQLKAAA
jgi:tetratricopeptide (TPR) repeat protein